MEEDRSSEKQRAIEDNWADRYRESKEREIKKLEAPILEDLNKLGFGALRHLYDFPESSGEKATAIPVLIEHFGAAKDSRLKTSIARALRVEESRAYWNEIEELFRASSFHDAEAEDPKTTLAITLSEIANNSLIERVITLVRDYSDSPIRFLFAKNLARSTDPAATQLLRKMRSSPEVQSDEYEKRVFEKMFAGHQKRIRAKRRK